MLLVSTIAIGVLSIIFFVTRHKMNIEEYKRIIKVNLFIPWCFIMLFTTLHYILPDKTFYDVFSTQREVKTYEQFMEENGDTKDQQNVHK